MLKPLGDRIVIEPQKQEERTAGGIVLPENTKEKPMKGTVVSVGPGRLENRQRIAPEVKPGDLVMFNKYAGTEVKVDNQTYLIMRESDIMAILEPSKEKELVANG
ncbi:co-chaperone GroES [Paenibacillus flagellatus]|uniref:Co-chaperonin GroES n=1 Tax=Paenibacillus flagellatus TaxID=2211139 RepID=A0A2V5K8F9_9BACL|nr:co-chaperone GroES [Paenibacillus flagellatus]PYI54294.1 co-chaperone GroES [Paenibacillus flagellatus]